MNVALDPEFAAAVDGALQDRRPGMVLLTANGEAFLLWMLRDYLKIRARHQLPPHDQGLVLVTHETTEQELLHQPAGAKSGDVVIFDELRPQDGALEHSVIAAAQLAKKGATVIATIHGGTAEMGLFRLKQLWAAAGQPESTLPQARFIPFAGKVGFKPV